MLLEARQSRVLATETNGTNEDFILLSKWL